MLNNSKVRAGLLAAAVFAVYYFSNPKPQNYYDYTFRVAENLLEGRIGSTEKPPGWLNEFVPFEAYYYSVFPLGSVLTMLPFAMLKTAGLIAEMPAAFIASFTAAAIIFFLTLIGGRYSHSVARKVLMPFGFVFATWMWTDLTMAGAWQLALGFAMLGELGAIWFTIYDPQPLLAGAFFALAFGNRTEIVLTAPIFLYLIYRAAAKSGEASAVEPFLRKAVAFCLAPLLLGVATLVYNYLRFHSFTDFGYARIPGVINEPWYDHGIFSLYYIPRQASEMLIKPWEWRPQFPYLAPNGFSSSILISSPFLLYALRTGSRDAVMKYSAWTAVLVLTLLLWIHGNSGGWQFGYRYAMVILPWLFVIMMESSPKKVSRLEWAAYVFSFIANVYATWLFHWVY